ncbi:MAG: 30S ribosomal protein S17 [Bdellovibrionales bacterium]|nr:30S ribosomal protein S17 [Bdellovibrionales bacterium]
MVTEKKTTKKATTPAPAKKAKAPAAARAVAVASERGRRQELVGEVVSNKMQKTISVLVYRQVRHTKYGKYLRMSSVFKAHDETNKAKIGDTVRITETKPLSKTKRWTLTEIVESAVVQGANS